MVNITDYISLAKEKAWKRYQQFSRFYEMDDLIQIAYEGLIKAAKNFDESKGVKFLTYAYKYVDLYILRCIRDDKRFLSNRANRFKTPLPVSLESLLFEENEHANLLDILSYETNDYGKVEINLMINSLPGLCSKIIKLKYFGGFTQREISKILRMSQSTISKYENKALELLKEQLVY